MIYGLWRSAAGVMTANHRTDVISNNLANAMTTGFKRDMVNTQQRRLAAQELPQLSQFASPFYDRIGGGTLVSPTATDHEQGMFEQTSNPLDMAIAGPGYFVVEKDGKQFLTRNGNFMVDRKGELVMADQSAARVLNRDGRPILLNPNLVESAEVGQEGQIIQGGVPVATVALKAVDPETLLKRGGHLLEGAETDVRSLPDAKEATVRGGMLEQSNVDPTTELTAMIQSQRFLEANANMIRYQDQMLGRLVNDVGKVS